MEGLWRIEASNTKIHISDEVIAEFVRHNITTENVERVDVSNLTPSAKKVVEEISMNLF